MIHPKLHVTVDHHGMLPNLHPKSIYENSGHYDMYSPGSERVGYSTPPQKARGLSVAAAAYALYSRDLPSDFNATHVDRQQQQRPYRQSQRGEDSRNGCHANSKAGVSIVNSWISNPNLGYPSAVRDPLKLEPYDGIDVSDTRHSTERQLSSDNNLLAAHSSGRFSRSEHNMFYRSPNHMMVADHDAEIEIRSRVQRSQSQFLEDDEWRDIRRRDSTSSVSSAISGSDESSPPAGSTDNGQKDSASLMRALPPCRICGARASGFHYGVNSCEACKGFFRRALKRPFIFYCTKDKTCDIKGNRRSTCRFCRYKRCLSLGMSREAIKTGRYSHKKRTSDIIEVKQLQNTPGFPIDEPDFDNVINCLLAAHEAQRTLSSSKESDESIVVLQKEHLSVHGGSGSKNKARDENEREKDKSVSPNPKCRLPQTCADNASDDESRPCDNICVESTRNYQCMKVSSPSLSSSSNDSGFNEDGISTNEDPNTITTPTHCDKALDLSCKSKKYNDLQAAAADDQTKPANSSGKKDTYDAYSEASSRTGRKRSRDTTLVGGAVEADSLASLGVASGANIGTEREDRDKYPSDLSGIKYRRLEEPSHAVEKSVSRRLEHALAANHDLAEDDQRSNSHGHEWMTAEVGSCHDRGSYASQDSACVQIRPEDECDSDATVSDSDADCRDEPEGHHDVIFLSHLKKEVTKDSAAKSCRDQDPTSSVQRAEDWVTGYISFAKSIPGFTNLSVEAKGVLLRLAWDEVWMLQAYRGYNSDLGVVQMPSGRCFYLDEMNQGWGQEFTQVAFDVANMLKKCSFNQEMLVLLKAVCIVSPDRCPATDRDKAEQIHWFLVTCLLKLLDASIAEGTSTFPKLVSVLTALRDLSESAQRNRNKGQLDQSLGGALFPDCISA